MNTTIGDAMILGITKINDTIKTIAPELWRIYLKQVYVNSIQMISAAVIGFTISGILLYVNRYFFKKHNEDEDEGHNIVGIYVGILSAIFFVASILLLFSGVAKLYNPEYYAIKMIAYDMIP